MKRERGRAMFGQSPVASGREGWPCAGGVGSEQELQQRMGGTQVEEGVQASFHSARACFFNKSKAQEFAELCVHKGGFEAEQLRGLAGGEGFFRFQEAQALHPDGREGRTPWGPLPRGKQRKDRAGPWDGFGGGRGLGGEECLEAGIGIILFRGGGPGAVDGMGDHAQEVLDLFGEFAVHGGLPPKIAGEALGGCPRALGGAGP
jgi:hypothetical protein